MTDIEYHYDIFCKYGLFSIFQKSEKGRERCFDGKTVINKGMLETVTVNKPNKRKAYCQAWINLHYPDRAAVKKSMQNDWNELCELNPELKEIKFDREDMALLGMARAGVTYGFPKEDIALFLNEHYKGNTGFRHRDRIKKESRDAGLPADFSFGWVPSSATIKKIGELYKAVQKEKTEEKQTVLNIPARFLSAKVIEKGGIRFSEPERKSQNVSAQIAVALISGKKLQM